ncbi:MAG: hypothetical protein IK021_04280, partial [Methanobrevibacter sp.]|nr:hypothetical protein [Methanobrevibacter sp.]
MLKKRYLFLIMIVCLFTISAVSAQEIANDTNIMSNDYDSSLLTESVDKNVLTESYGTFQELQDEINAVEKGGTLNLTRNYKYVNGSTEGLHISNPITVNGNGFTLDGNGQSRIFGITGNNVILNNIIFMNGNGSYGGAIYFNAWNSSINNSKFIYNVAYGGGAIYFGYDSYVVNITNCDFENNSATNGGAINFHEVFSTSISNSNFINNSATNGGAIYASPYGMGCSFIIKENCKFINNSAQLGSAIFQIGERNTWIPVGVSSGILDSYFYSNENTVLIYLEYYSELFLKNNTMISSAPYTVYIKEATSKITSNSYLILENVTSLPNKIFDVLTFTDDVGNKIRIDSPIVTLTVKNNKFLSKNVDAKFNSLYVNYYMLFSEIGVYDASANTTCA